MFERFTERARQVVVLAQDAARALQHECIGSEHILLGILREDGVGKRALEALGVDAERAEAGVVRIVGKGDNPQSGQIPFTPRAKKILDLSLREALSLGHNYIGTEHILLGLVRENEGVAARILLSDFDLGPEKIENEITRVLTGYDKEAEKRESPARRQFIVLVELDEFEEAEATAGRLTNLVKVGLEQLVIGPRPRIVTTQLIPPIRLSAR